MYRGEDGGLVGGSLASIEFLYGMRGRVKN